MTTMVRRLAWLLALAALGVALAPRATKAQVLSGKVATITDGDTITILSQGREVMVRLEGIDCPEDGQPYTDEATRCTSELVSGRTVTIRVKDQDHYGRTVGRVYVGDTDVSLELVRSGLAWHFTKYSSDPALARAEVEARMARRGLWRDPDPTPPWEYRRPPAGPARGPYHGNVRSLVFHRPGCKWYDCKSCTREFATREQALAAGFRPGGCCRP